MSEYKENNKKKKKKKKVLSDYNNRFDNIEGVVRWVYPDHEWAHERFTPSSLSPKKSLTNQLYLERIIKSIFHHNNSNNEKGEKEEEGKREEEGEKLRIMSNARTAHGILGPSGIPLEIDVYLPDLNIGFEYQVLITPFLIVIIDILLFILFLISFSFLLIFLRLA